MVEINGVHLLIAVARIICVYCCSIYPVDTNRRALACATVSIPHGSGVEEKAIRNFLVIATDLRN